MVVRRQSKDAQDVITRAKYIYHARARIFASMRWLINPHAPLQHLTYACSRRFFKVYTGIISIRAPGEEEYFLFNFIRKLNSSEHQVTYEHKTRACHNYFTRNVMQF